jgi:hypothetical protein
VLEILRCKSLPALSVKHPGNKHFKLPGCLLVLPPVFSFGDYFPRNGGKLVGQDLFPCVEIKDKKFISGDIDLNGSIALLSFPLL